MKNNQPLISIITVVYNGDTHLEQTIQSVIGQSYKNIEYIVIDGGSTDSTIDIIKKYEERITYWISEKDNGIYDAMNKGVQVATGDFVNFLNADDTICADNALEYIVGHMDQDDSVYFSRARIVSDTISWIYPAKEVVNMEKWLKWNLPNHQTMFFPKSFYKNHLYDTRLKIGADDDYKLFALRNKDVRFIDMVYVEFKRGGISSNHKNVHLLIQRIKESYIRNFKHQRWGRLILDPFKLMIMYLIHILFGEDNFLKFIKYIVKIKSSM